VLTVETICHALPADPAGVAVAWPLVLQALDQQGINTLPVQIAAAATIQVEVGKRWQPIRELGSNSYFTRMYEGRLDLGNTEPGDGAR